ncbi:protein Vhl [Scaptodrosophila lebanonensis]|uniref:Protein Vhl n=1 Tax=Drosophila lebanonensis TaxID=7225 RepID=A0A6J2U4S6_DROLE|nr:protein Vhl [Scaptodrosophila lebanonensis]
MSLQIARNNRNWRDGQPPQRPLLPPELVEVFVLFINTTNRTLDLYWICERENDNIYLTLKPNEEVRVNTYNTHSWFFRDYYTGESMHVRSKRLFSPVRIRVPHPQRPDQMCDVRSQVLIHFPLRTLKENCLWLIVKMLVRSGDSPREAIESYFIPMTLKQQLLALLGSIETYRTQANTRRPRFMVRR